jgi:hypothetical protein
MNRNINDLVTFYKPICNDKKLEIKIEIIRLLLFLSLKVTKTLQGAEMNTWVLKGAFRVK